MPQTVRVPLDLVAAARLRLTLNNMRGVVSSKVIRKLAAARVRRG